MQLTSNQLALIAIIALFIVITLLLGLIIFLLYLFAKTQKNLALGPIENVSSKKDINKEIAFSEKCSIHPDQKSHGLCAICEKTFCDKCLKNHDKLLFCPEHYELFRTNSWVGIETVKTTPQTPKDGIFLYSFKEKLWQIDGLPSYIVTHYTINVEQDHIESYVTLFIRERDKADLSEKLKLFNDRQI